MQPGQPAQGAGDEIAAREGVDVGERGEQQLQPCARIAGFEGFAETRANDGAVDGAAGDTAAEAGAGGVAQRRAWPFADAADLGGADDDERTHQARRPVERGEAGALADAAAVHARRVGEQEQRQPSQHRLRPAHNAGEAMWFEERAAALVHTRGTIRVSKSSRIKPRRPHAFSSRLRVGREDCVERYPPILTLALPPLVQFVLRVRVSGLRRQLEEPKGLTFALRDSLTLRVEHGEVILSVRVALI